jgi:hypothetical protein
MSTRRLIFVGVLTLCVGLAAQVAAPLFAQQKDDVQPSDKDRQTEQELDVQYAKAYLKLVEATLAKYQETNRRSPNTIRRGVITAIEENVRTAGDRVKLAESDDVSDAQIYVSSAEARLRASQESLRKAESVNLQRPGTIGAPEVARLKAEIELGEMRIAKAKHLASESPLSNVRFEIEQLREDVAELRLIVSLLRDRN